MGVLFTLFLRVSSYSETPAQSLAVLKLVLRMKSPDMGILFPLLPFGYSSPAASQHVLAFAAA